MVILSLPLHSDMELVFSDKVVLLLGHGEQELAASLSEYVPIGHGKQVVEFS